MAKKKENTVEDAVESVVAEAQKPRLVKLIVKNFRCICNATFWDCITSNLTCDRFV